MTHRTSYRAGEFIWADVTTPDMAATTAFYGELFGWTAEAGPEEFGGYSNFHLDGRKVCGVLPMMAPGQPPAWTAYFCTDDSDKTNALVQDAGGTVIAPPMDVADLGRMAVYLDTTGVFFGTWQPGTHLGAEIADEPNALTWAELSTTDAPAAEAFYGTALGWTTRSDQGYTEFQSDGRSTAGLMVPPEGAPSLWLPYVATPDPAAKAAEAARLGGTVMVPATDFPGGRFAVVQDLHGATFGLLDLRH